MVIGVKKELSCRFKILKEMTNAHRLEAVSIEVWKNKIKIPCIAVYNSPKNTGCYDVLPCEEKCSIFGDFNSPSTRWGYNSTTSAGRNAEDFVDSNPIERIPSTKPNDFTFINTRG